MTHTVYSSDCVIQLLTELDNHLLQTSSCAMFLTLYLECVSHARTLVLDATLQQLKCTLTICVLSPEASHCSLLARFTTCDAAHFSALAHRLCWLRSRTLSRYALTFMTTSSSVFLASFSLALSWVCRFSASHRSPCSSTLLLAPGASDASCNPFGPCHHRPWPV